jgi:hypothetical protein
MRKIKRDQKVDNQLPARLQTICLNKYRSQYVSSKIEKLWGGFYVLVNKNSGYI